MMRSAMQKKLTLRVLAMVLVLMTAIAFMPTVADTVWANEESPTTETTTETTPGTTEDESGTPTTEKTYIKAGSRGDTDGDGIPEFVIDVGCGDVVIRGQSITYYEYVKNEITVNKGDGGQETVVYYTIEPRTKSRDNTWDHELVLSGTTPSTYEVAVFNTNGGLAYEPGTYTPQTEKVTPMKDISADATGPSRITINNGSGKTHSITFENLNMSPMEGSTDAYQAVTLNANAYPTITLAGENSIESKYAPAINVPSNAGLTLLEQTYTEKATTTLPAKKLTTTASGGDCAAIGSMGNTGIFGKIEIQSGEINATGSGTGAGIGGSGTGFGNINITGGTITAKGGNAADTNTAATGAHGIGNGALGSTSGGSITITGKDTNITAAGGTSIEGVTAAGIASQDLSSKGGTAVLSSTNGILSASSDDDDFNAVVWTDSPDNQYATIYGDALLVNKNNTSESIQGTYQPVDLGSATVTIPEGSSITAPPGTTYYFNTTDPKATLIGGGTLSGSFNGYHTEGPKPVVSLALGNNSEIERGKKGQHDYIHVIGLDTKTYKEFNGKAKKLIGDLITIDKTTKEGELLDVDNWTITVKGTKNSNATVKHDEIINADTYVLTFSHVHGYYPSFDIGGVKILPKQLEDCDLEMESSFEYGEEITHSIVDDDTDKELVNGQDYDVKYYRCDDHGNLGEEINIEDPDDLNVGSYAAVFSTKASIATNYTTYIDSDGDGTLDEDKPMIVEFEIEPADITDAVISGFKSTYTYDGEDHLDAGDIEVSLNGKEIDSSEYDIEFDNSSLSGSASEYTDKERLTYAGIVTITVIAKDKNYTGEASVTFEIARKPIDIKEAKASYTLDDGTEVSSRVYDGTKIVNITSVSLDAGDIEGDDKVAVSLEGLTEDPTDDLTGSLSGANVGDYKNVSLKNVRLTGDDAFNYVVKDATVKLGPKAGGFDNFTITPLVVEKPILSVTDKSSGGDSEKFQCTVKVDNQPNDGATYVYAMAETSDADVDTLKWQSSNTFDKLLSNTEYWFYAKIDPKNSNLKAEDPADMVGYTKHKTPLIPQNPPEDFELEITLDPNGETYTVTIPMQEGAQYSFDGKSYTKSNVKKKVGPNETVTGYARFPATKTHAISEPTVATETTPPLIVKTPVISPEDGAFYGSVQVTITCGTKDATIYYTLDGNYPTESDQVYRGPITITEDTTVSAVAVKKDMTESELVSMDYVYTEFPPKSKSNITKGVKATNDLKNSAFSQKDSITAALSKAITEDGGGYTYQNIAYFDLNLQLSFDNGKTYVKADAENFPEEGVEITVKVPDGTSTSTHDFRVAHMFSETSDRLGITAGEIEKPEPTENGEGLTFTVTGCSPLAIGWVETDDGSAAGGDEGEDANKDDENINASAGDNADTLNAEVQTGNANGDAANAAGGANADGANANGTGANADGTSVDGENAEAADGGVVDELVKAVTTGDFTNPILWAAIAAACLLIIIVMAVASRRRS